ncbi:hypothetical protein NP493_1622g00000 [Ridgeia piscesae]
MSKTG